MGIHSCAQMLEFHADAVDGKAVAAAWLGALPLMADEMEANVAHEQLVRMVEASDPRCNRLHAIMLLFGRIYLPQHSKVQTTAC